ncbi:hypothetical protein [Thioalkalivibrio sp.]|uniref:hypothetical protein n=1 Tax=Thioalkalivibrio sp. TaxID=2093813 RepID=UPI003561F2BB
MPENEIPPLLPRFREGLRWSLQLGGRFLREAPGGTSLVVLATVLSQLAMLLAFFLPLKVVILLGSERIPRYFPAALAEFDRDTLIVALTLATVGAFGVYLLAERLIRFGSDRGARRILERSRKVVLFEDQDGIATRAYRRYAVIPAGLVFLLLGTAVLAVLYPSVLGLMIAFLSLVALLVVLGSRFSGGLRRKVLAPPRTWLPGVAGFGFLLVFVWLVADYLYRDPPGLLAAIVALLLARQMLNRLAGMVTSLVSLNRERPRLDALFFHHQVFQRRRQGRGEGLWALLAEAEREEWLPRVLRELEDAPGRVRRSEWWQTRVPDVMAIHCEMEGSEPRLVKVFGPHRSGEARHEASLLADPPADLPAPGWIGATLVDGLHCHVLRLPEETAQVATRRDPAPEDDDGPGNRAGSTDSGRSPDPGEAGPSPEGSAAPDLAELAYRFRRSLIAVEPPEELAGRYGRSRPLLWQRLDRAMFERARLVADVTARETIDELLADFQAIVDRVRSLPWVFVNRQLNPGTLATAGDDVIALHWGRWGLETVGTAWPLAALEPDTLSRLLAEVGPRRPALADVPPAGVRLAGLLSLMERLYLAQRYADILELLPELEGTWRSLGREAGPASARAAATALVQGHPE